MQALKFRLGGNTAFFKKPDVNSEIYFTYSQIHRVALLGLLGAIIGYKGYNENDRKGYPEFYSKLKKLKIAIVPLPNNDMFDKKVQTFNNSTGCASNEANGTIIVKQVWLENPSWNIYILLDNKESYNLSEYILRNKSVFMPYLGSNDHVADIDMVEVIKIYKSDKKKIDSIFLKDDLDIDYNGIDIFKYEENLPFALEENTDRHIRKKSIITNGIVIDNHEKNYLFIDKDSMNNIAFYSEEGLYEYWRHSN